MGLNLTLDLFIKAGEDYEKRQYVVLGSIKQVKQEFQKNRLYPHLSDLITLRTSLQQVIDGFTSVDKNGPKRIKDINLKENRIEFESVLSEQMDLEAVRELIKWSQPLIDAAIEEGISIYEYVDENLNIDQVGIKPSYLDEGYLFVPNHENGSLQLFRYEMSIYMGAREKYRSLKTTLIKTMNEGLISVSSPAGIKLELIKQFQDLPNPATYAFYTPLEFSFESTLFPVAKRKLLRMLVS